MKLSELKFKTRMVSHMALKTNHLSMHEIEIVCPGNLLDGRKFYREDCTRKHGEYGGFGKTTSIFYFPKGKTFKTIEACLESIGIEIK